MNFGIEIEQLISAAGATRVGIAFCDLATGEEFQFNGDEAFHAASTMKVCVLMELFHQAELGELGLDEAVEIRNEFPSIVDGSPFSVGEEDDSEKSLHHRIGELETLILLARPMIIESSNLATNLLVDRSPELASRRTPILIYIAMG